MSIVRDWTESIWGSGGLYTGFQQRLGNPETIAQEDRDSIRMPNKTGEKALHDRDGYHCRFCGIHVIRKAVRE